jgi:NADH pyrophosphatase NudC (nudix superfamily)
MGESGKRYCQSCGESRFQQDTDKPQPCLKCSGVNFDRRPKPHVGIIKGFWLTDEDKIFLKVQRIKVEEETTYGNDRGTDGTRTQSRGW